MICYRVGAAWLLAAQVVLGQTKLPVNGQVDLSLNHQIVLGEPYSATRRITTEETHPGAKPVRHIVIRLEARNAAGWEWSRAPLHIKGMEYTEAQQIKGTGPMTYVVWDPVQHLKTEWCSCRQTATSNHFDSDSPRPESDAVGETLRGSTRDLMEAMSDVPEFKVTKMEPRALLGLSAEGVRATRADAVETVGFGKHDSTIGIEVWYAPELHLELSTLVSDAKAGVTGNSIIALTRGDPDPALFRVPDNLSKPTKSLLFAMRNTSSKPTKDAEKVKKSMPMPATPSAPVPSVPAAPAEVATVATPAKAAAPKPLPPSLPDLNPKTKNKPLTPVTRTEKPKIYRKAPPGWPAGLPPL